MGTLAIALLGAGRMGRQLAAAMAEAPGEFRLAGAWARPGSDSARALVASLPAGLAGDAVVDEDLRRVLEGAEVAIDFTLPSATRGVLDAVTASGTPLVCGVSGIGGPELDAMRAAAARLPIFYDRNMSVGLALLRRAVEDAARVLGPEFAASISDLHHEAKRDAPSGTALMLGEALARARQRDFADVMRYEPDLREGQRRDAGDIVFRVRREGQHPGTHAVRLAGRTETLEFCHEVFDRRVFADGALRAARWLRGRGPGLYGMDDLLAGG